jgi:geranylgeranyl diphosphate synthase type II
LPASQKNIAGIWILKKGKGIQMETIMDFFNDKKRLIDQKLEAYLRAQDPLLENLIESMNYSLYSGGKRVRPLLCFVVGELLNVPDEQTIPVSCALEMIHTASLIIDDLPYMDDSLLRRGKRANHLVYGRDVAVLAGIGLLINAFKVILDDTKLPDHKKILIVRKITNLVGINGMVGGQFVDVKYSHTSKDESVLKYIHTHKTAALFEASVISTALIGEATEEEYHALEIYAKKLGYAFQVFDDLLDVSGKVNDVGKTVQRDTENFVILYGAQKAKQMIEECKKMAIEAIQIFDGKNKKLLFLAEMLVNRKS